MRENLREVVSAIYSNMHSRTFVPPVQSLMDVDFYKFTMGQFIHRFYPDVEVTFKLILRDKNIRLWKYVNMDELRMALDHVQSLSMRKTDLYYLRGMDLYDKYMFSEDYLSFLKGLRLSGYSLEQRDGSVELSFTTRWCEVTYWETIAMAIVSELYYRGVMKSLSEEDVCSIYTVADNRLQNNLFEIKKHPEIRFADFGQRRRNSFLWQKYVVGESSRVLGSQFTGSSNTWMAFHYDLNAIGTNAHELPMVVTAIADSEVEMRLVQYKVLKEWQSMYGEGLQIILPDTYGSTQFFAHAPAWLSSWKGQRQDSGDPLFEIDQYMKWLTSHTEDPTKKITIPSDGLTVTTMKTISEYASGKQLTPFGWGTGLTNDFAGTIPGNDDMRPFSMVVKTVSANGRPCVKLSNNPNKATGPKDEVVRYLRIFGEDHMVPQEVLV